MKMSSKCLIALAFVCLWNTFGGGAFFALYMRDFKRNSTDYVATAFVIIKMILGPCFACIIYHHAIARVRLYKLLLLGVIVFVLEASFIAWQIFPEIVKRLQNNRTSLQVAAFVLFLTSIEVICAFGCAIVLRMLHQLQREYQTKEDFLSLNSSIP